jgi:adenosine kinase
MADILICGTLAFDLIGRFSTAELHPAARNVKLDRLDDGFGGCAMNIAYNLALLGHHAVPLVYAGSDYTPHYTEHVRRSGISELGIFHDPTSRSARGFVFTGPDDAQFTAFYPGPTGLGRVAEDLGALTGRLRFDAAILAPDLPAKTLACAAAISGIPLRVWCPGQYAEHIDAADARRLLAAVDLVLVNRHEWESLRQLVPEYTRSAAGSTYRIVVTGGPDPVLAYPDALTIPVPSVAPGERVDPTGCGDAFAAALTAALVEGRSLAAAIRAGISLAARCLRRPGAQNH